VRYGGVNPHSSMMHLNGNLLCAVDVETTGLDPAKHDVIQIAVLPLDSEIKPLKTVFPFYMNMAPKRPENIDYNAMAVSKIDCVKLINNSIDPWKAVDLFEEWFTKLNLPVGKKIVPLAHNWQFDRSFILEWLGGPKCFEFFFHHCYRDSMTASLYLNDRAEQFIEKIPIPKVTLSYCGSVLGVPNAKAHDALQDCIQTAEVYRRMLTMFTPNSLGRTKDVDQDYSI
jgi:DNA polymerase III, epsilon subunit and related 3''-5'' exonucleases